MSGHRHQRHISDGFRIVFQSTKLTSRETVAPLPRIFRYIGKPYHVRHPTRAVKLSVGSVDAIDFVDFNKVIKCNSGQFRVLIVRSECLDAVDIMAKYKNEKKKNEKNNYRQDKWCRQSIQ